MDIKEYKERVKHMEAMHKKELQAFASEYAMSNNIVKDGDIVSNGKMTVLVDRISLGYFFGEHTPQCIYTGPELTKKGTPYKNGQREAIYQLRLKTINGEPVK